MYHDAVANVYWDRQYEEYPDLQLWLVDDDDRLIAESNAVAIPFGPDELPDDGWDAALATGVRGPAREGGLGDRDLGRCRAPREGTQQDDARRDAEGGRSARSVGSRRAGAAEPEAPLPARSDRPLRGVAPRGREAARSVAARARGCGRAAHPGRARVDADLRHGRRVGGLDEDRLPGERYLRRPGCARPGRDRPRARRGRLRRAQRLDAPPV